MEEPPGEDIHEHGHKLSVGMTLLIALLALLLIGGGGLIYYTIVFQPARLSRQATATEQAYATRTAIAGITGQSPMQSVATVQAARAQLTATVAALQGIYTQATKTRPIIIDSLSRQDKYHWDSDKTCVFAGSAYHVFSSQPNTFFTCNAQSTHFHNFVVQVQMTITAGDYGGIDFRSDKTAANAYTFTIYRSGAYFLDLYQNNSQVRTLSSGSSTVIKTGLNQPNLIAVVAQDEAFYLYINGVFIASASDMTYSAGKIGLIGGESTNSADVAYSNLKVWLL